MNRATALVSILALALGLCSCSDDEAVGPDLTGAQQEVALAEQALANGDIVAANQHFKSALAKDATNAVANLGAAVTEIYLLQNDPAVAGLIDLFNGASGVLPLATPKPGTRAASPGFSGRLSQPSRASTVLNKMNLSLRGRYDVIGGAGAMFRFLLRAATEPPPIAAIQNVIRNKVLPKLAYAKARIAQVETNPSFVWMLPADVAGTATDIEIDRADVLLLDALLHTVRGTLGVLVAYDVSVPSYTYVNVESLFTDPGSDWGTLHADGATWLSTARSDWLTAISRMNSAVASVLAETDDQSDDLIPKEALGTPTDITEFTDGLAELETALTGPVYVRFTNYYAMPDSERVNAQVFFTDPIEDLRTVVPEHTFDLDHQLVPNDPLTFPDPTFNGIFPDLTNERIRYLMGILPISPSS